MQHQLLLVNSKLCCHRHLITISEFLPDDRFIALGLVIPGGLILHNSQIDKPDLRVDDLVHAWRDGHPVEIGHGAHSGRVRLQSVCP